MAILLIIFIFILLLNGYSLFKKLRKRREAQAKETASPHLLDGEKGMRIHKSDNSIGKNNDTETAKKDFVPYVTKYNSVEDYREVENSTDLRKAEIKIQRIRANYSLKLAFANSSLCTSTF